MPKPSMSRRDLWNLGAVATCGLAVNERAAAQSGRVGTAPARPDLAAEFSLLEREYDGTFHVDARRLDAAGDFTLRADSILPTASTCKLFVLCELFRQAEAGTIDLDASLGWNPEQHRGGDGVLRAMVPGQRLSIHNMAVLMITLSDNIATTALVDLLGAAQVNASLERWRLADSDFHLGLPGGPATDQMKQPVSSPRDFRSLLERIHRHEILTPKSCVEIVRILRAQRINDMMARYIPVGEDWGAAEEWIANKTGYGDCRVDVGIINTKALVLAMALFFKPNMPPPHRLKSMSDYPPVLAAAAGCRAIYEHFAS